MPVADECMGRREGGGDSRLIGANIRKTWGWRFWCVSRTRRQVWIAQLLASVWESLSKAVHIAFFDYTVCCDYEQAMRSGAIQVIQG